MVLRTKNHWSHSHELTLQSFDADTLIPLLKEVGLSLFIDTNNKPRWDLFSLAANMQGYEPYIALFYLKNLTHETIAYLDQQNANALNAFILNHEKYLLFHNPQLASSTYIEPFFSQDQLNAYNPDIVCRTEAIAKCKQDDAMYAMKYWQEDIHASNWVHHQIEYWCNNATSADNVQEFLDFLIQERNPLFTRALKTYIPSKPNTMLELLMYLREKDDIRHDNICVIAFNALATFSVEEAVTRLKMLSQSIGLDFSPVASEYCFSAKALEIYVTFMASQEKMSYAYVTEHPLWEALNEDTKKQWYEKCLKDEKFRYENIPPHIVTAWAKKTLLALKYSSDRHQSTTLDNLQNALSYFKDSTKDADSNTEMHRLDTIVSCISLYQTALMFENTKSSLTKMPGQINLIKRYTAKQTKLLVDSIPQDIHTWKNEIPISDLKNIITIIGRILKNNALDLNIESLERLNETTAAMRSLDPQWNWYNTFVNIISPSLENDPPVNPLLDLTP